MVLYSSSVLFLSLLLKLTWAGFNDLINRGKKKSRRFSSVRCPTSGNLTYDPTEITNIFNKHFSSVGHRLASNSPPSNRHFSESDLRGNYEKSFFFDPVAPTEIEREILSIPLNKAHGLYSCLNRFLRSPRYILSYPLAKLMNLSVTSGEYPTKLKHAKVIPVYKDDDETDPANYRPISLLSNYNHIFEKIMFNRLKAFIDKKKFFIDRSMVSEIKIPLSMQYLRSSTPYKGTWTTNYFRVVFSLT